MQYFVGYLVEGEASEYYKALTSDLNQRFGIKNLSEYIPPHLTLKIPFEPDSIEDFEKYVATVSETLSTVDLSVDGFEKFDGKRMTIFLRVAVGENIKTIEEVVDHLESYSEYTKKLPRPLTLHSSIARFLSPEQCDEIWSYLQTLPTPQFNLVFNNLTIFKLVDGIWGVHKTFTF
ncbi:MAG TPA: 2'-5' RNA ligase family protein [Candidatus Paceibacterota bacterium]